MLGAVLAPTDAVAATAIFRRLGAPERVRLLVEGESMINDGTALVLYRIAVGVATGERLQPRRRGAGVRRRRRSAASPSASRSASSPTSSIRRQTDSGLVIVLTVLDRLRRLHRRRGAARLRHPRRRRRRPLRRLPVAALARRRHPAQRRRLLERARLRPGDHPLRPARPAAAGRRRRPRRRAPPGSASCSGRRPGDRRSPRSCVRLAFVFAMRGDAGETARRALRGRLERHARRRLAGGGAGGPAHVPGRPQIIFLTFALILITLVGQGLSLPSSSARCGWRSRGAGATKRRWRGWRRRSRRSTGSTRWRTRSAPTRRS